MQKHSILDAWMGSEYACVQNASNNVLCHHNKRLMGYFEFLCGSGIICFPLNIPEKVHWRHLSEKPEEAESHRLHLINTMIQYNTTALCRTASAIQSNARVPPPFFYSETNPVFGHVLIHSIECSGCNSGIDLFVTLKYTFFQLCSNAEQISVRLARFRRSYVKHRAVVLTSLTSYIAFLLDVRCAVQSGRVFFAAVCPW